jgi:hypothetical protein
MLGASLVHEIPSEVTCLLSWYLIFQIFSEGVSQVTTGGNPDDNLFVLAYQCLQDFADLRRDMKENEPYFLKLSHLSGKSLHLGMSKTPSFINPRPVTAKFSFQTFESLAEGKCTISLGGHLTRLAT